MNKKLFFLILIFVLIIQFIPIERINHKINHDLELKTNEKVMNLLKKSCYDCHSEETKWSKYAYIAPLSFGVISHVKDGRKALNFSKYKKIPKDIKIARLKRAISTLKIETMPLPSYLLFHNEAKLTQENKNILIKWFEEELEKLKRS